MITVKVNGKNRVIRDKFIDYHTENDLYCTYKNHFIRISAQDTGGFYCTVTDQTGMYAVDGGFGEYHNPPFETIEDCLKMCIENII